MDVPALEDASDRMLEAEGDGVHILNVAWVGRRRLLRNLLICRWAISRTSRWINQLLSLVTGATSNIRLLSLILLSPFLLSGEDLSRRWGCLGWLARLIGMIITGPARVFLPSR